MKILVEKMNRTYHSSGGYSIILIQHLRVSSGVLMLFKKDVILLKIKTMIWESKSLFIQLRNYGNLVIILIFSTLKFKFSKDITLLSIYGDRIKKFLILPESQVIELINSFPK
jgi:hypothetical protein